MNILFYYLIGVLITYFYLLNRYLVMKEAIELIEKTDSSLLTYGRFLEWTKEHKPTLYFVHILTNGDSSTIILLGLVWWLIFPMMFFYWLSKPIKRTINPSKVQGIGRELIVGVAPYKVVDAFERSRDHP